MRLSRSSACIAAVAVLFATFGVQSSARPATGIVVENGRTQPVFSYKDAIRETVYVQSSIDGDSDGDLDLLATDIIRPQESKDGLKVPVIYEQSPYYQTLGRGNESEVKAEEDGDFIPPVFPLFYDNYFVPRGYAFIAQDMPGTRNSEGCTVLGGRAELLAAKATIDWLNGRGKAFDPLTGEEVHATWATGKVGMIGKSYDGSVANGAASLGVEGLETIVPIGGIARWYDYHLNNGVQYVNAYTTPGLFSFVIDQQPADDEERRQEWVENTFTENSTCTAVGTQVVAQAGDPRADYNEFWDERDYLKDVDKVRAAVFVVHGLNDWNVKPNNWVQWWEGLARHGVPRKLWLAQPGHVDPFEFRRKVWVETLHRWFDRWLHGIDNGIMRESRVTIERRADVFRNYRDWPLPGSSHVTMRLAPKLKKRPGTLALRLRESRRRFVQSYRDDPQQEESSMASGKFQTKPTRLLFLTRKLRRAVHLSGTPRVEIRATVDRPDTNFTALLVDYGKAVRVDHEGSGEGVRQLEKESCHGQSTEADDACYFLVEKTTHRAPYEIVSRGWLDARHRESLRTGEPLEPGTAYTFRWEVFGEDYVFARGHRIGLVIAGSDATYTVPDPEEASVSVKLRRSRFVLPVVGGAAALRAAL